VERNIKFTVGVGSSPQALTELKKFGEQVRAEQKKIWESSAAGMVKAYKDGLKAMHGGGGFVVEIKKEAAERKKAATSTTLDIQKIHARAEQDDYKFRRSLAVQHHREELKRIQDLKNSRIKAAREESQELAREAARAAKAGRGYVAQMREQQRNAALASSHRFGAMKGASDIGRGALEIGRGVAYSGLVGEDNTQTVIDTIARTESILSIYGGGTLAIKGAHYLAKRLKWLAGFAGMGGAAAAAGGGARRHAGLAAEAPRHAAAPGRGHPDPDHPRGHGRGRHAGRRQQPGPRLRRRRGGRTGAVSRED